MSAPAHLECSPRAPETHCSLSNTAHFCIWICARFVVLLRFDLCSVCALNLINAQRDAAGADPRRAPTRPPLLAAQAYMVVASVVSFFATATDLSAAGSSRRLR